MQYILKNKSKYEIAGSHIYVSNSAILRLLSLLFRVENVFGADVRSNMQFTNRHALPLF